MRWEASDGRRHPEPSYRATQANLVSVPCIQQLVVLGILLAAASATGHPYSGEERPEDALHALDTKLSPRLRGVLAAEAHHSVVVTFVAPDGFIVADEIGDPYGIEPRTASELGGDVAMLAAVARDQALTPSELVTYHEALSPAQGRVNRALVAAALFIEADRIRALPGIVMVESSNHSAPYALVVADRGAIMAIAAMPSVLSIDLHVYDQIDVLSGTGAW